MLIYYFTHIKHSIFRFQFWWSGPGATNAYSAWYLHREISCVCFAIALSCLNFWRFWLRQADLCFLNLLVADQFVSLCGGTELYAVVIGSYRIFAPETKKERLSNRSCIDLVEMSKVVYEGWMVRYGRRKIGRSFIQMRYFVLESRLLAYYKKKPQDYVVPTKTLLIDGNCRVEDRGLKTHHGHMVYVLSVYNKKEKHHRITMAAFNIQEALIWKERIESVIDQHQESQAMSGNKYQSFEYKSGMDNGRTASSSDRESQFSAAEGEEESHHDRIIASDTVLPQLQVASDKGLFSIVFNLQVPGSTHYSMVFYFVTKELLPGSLLQRFVDGDDEFRNSRLKLIPSVPKSVGSTLCILGKAVDCSYICGPKYLEIDVDIGSSTVANGVLGLVIGVITTLVVDMAFLVQANTTEELPERLIGAVRASHIELSSAIVPRLESENCEMEILFILKRRIFAVGVYALL
ncbi:enhanced disease resistance 2 [Striga asiatica]|uniref:Enhanced disease resistance 2 n=1 Tax=Striga asiatica TaxID=4170 RepID=A0A5A7RKD8_STRAF|nr:enhanced disease resistance 2 [Striga asiatica]